MYCFGLLHGSQLPPDSSLHSNEALQSSEEKPNEAAVDATVPEGPVAASVVSGAVVSTVQVRVGRALVDVPGEIGRADGEGVRSV